MNKKASNMQLISTPLGAVHFAKIPSMLTAVISEVHSDGHHCIDDIIWNKGVYAQAKFSNIVYLVAYSNHTAMYKTASDLTRAACVKRH